VRSLVGRADEVIERGAAQPRTWLIAVHESPPGPIRSRIRIQPDFLARLAAWRVVQLGGLAGRRAIRWLAEQGLRLAGSKLA
jgi:hypothetical protein